MFPDDRKLVRRCLDGQSEAFGLLYDGHGPRVYQFLRRLTGNDAAAQDLVQETFLAAYRSLAEWRGQGALGTWFCGIAFRLYRNAVRRDARHPSEPLEDQEALPAPEGDPLRHLVRRELQDRLEAAFGELPPAYRDVFILVKVEGLSYREAAGWLGVPLGTVQSRLWRAVCRLQVLLKDLQPEPSAKPAGVPCPGPVRSHPLCASPSAPTMVEGPGLAPRPASTKGPSSARPSRKETEP